MNVPSPGSDPLLVIMAKAPRAGRVKTRLAGDYDAAAIVELYRCLLADTLALARSIPDISVAVMAPPDDLDALTPLLPSGVTGLAQQGIGLAAALTSVFEIWTGPSARRVIAFNSDSPHLPPGVLLEAFEALATHDIVAGPTDDGGYYLVGATAHHPGLFEKAPLGTASALDALLGQARGHGLTCHLTPTWFDVDIAGDLARLAETLGRDPAAAPHTAALLRLWRTRDAHARPASDPDAQ